MATQPFRIPETPDYVGFARQNAMLDFSPINNAVSGFQQQQQRDVENKRAEDQLGFQRERLGMDKEKVSDDRKKNLIESFGNVAMLYDPAKDLDGAQWTGIVNRYDAKMRARDPSFSGSTPDYYDRVQGPKLILGDSKMAAQQLEYQRNKAADARASEQLDLNRNQDKRLADESTARLSQDAAQTYEERVKRASRFFTPAEQKLTNERYKQYLLSGTLPEPKPSTFDLAPDHTRHTMVDGPDGPVAKLLATGNAKGPDSTTKKAIFEAQDELPNIKSAIEQLKEAKELLGTDKDPGAYLGFGSAARSNWNQGASDILPNIISDPVRAEKTKRFNQIMDAEAISQMSQTLKGASTDKEMAAFVRIVNDPNVSMSTKQALLKAIILKTERHYQNKVERIKEFGGRMPDLGGPQLQPPQNGGGATDPLGIR